MTIRTVGLVGGGTMGQGIAITCAASGLDVLLLEKTPELARQSVEEIGHALDRDIAKWRRTESEKKAVLGRVRTVDDLGALEASDIVIECVMEDLELKTSIFQKLDQVCPPEDILATNTSSLSVTEIAARTRRSDRVIGLHFLQPVPQVPLVEVVRGLGTSDATFRQAMDFVRLLGKTGVEVFEYPGYVTTRVILPFLNEAMHVVMEGVATPEAVDTSMRLGYGLPVGPLALADRIGLDEVNRWMQYLFEELGDLKYRPCPLLRKMIRAGHLGVKGGRGFLRVRRGRQPSVAGPDVSRSRAWSACLAYVGALQKMQAADPGGEVRARGQNAGRARARTAVAGEAGPSLKVLVLNCGSSSVKFQLVETDEASSASGSRPRVWRRASSRTSAGPRSCATRRRGPRRSRRRRRSSSTRSRWSGSWRCSPGRGAG